MEQDIGLIIYWFDLLFGQTLTMIWFIYLDKHRQFSFYSNWTNTNMTKTLPALSYPHYTHNCTSYRSLSQETHIIHRPPHHHTAGPPGLHTPLQYHHRTTRTTHPITGPPQDHQDYTPHHTLNHNHHHTHHHNYHKTPPRPHCARRQNLYYCMVQWYVNQVDVTESYNK